MQKGPASMTKIAYTVGSKTPSLLLQTIGENLYQTCKKFPKHEALIVQHQNVRLSYSEFWKLTTSTAKALIHTGITKGDRVGIWSPNCYEWIILQYATARVGAILVNLNPAYMLEELEYAICQSTPRLVVSARKYKQTDYTKLLNQVQSKCSFLENIIYLGETWDAWIKNAAIISENALRRQESSLNCTDPINIQYTSGTTGFPKGATLTHKNILNNARFAGQNLKYTSQDRICIPVPFYHCFGMVLGNLACTVHGATIISPSESFNAGECLAIIHKERCTALYGVPTMFIKILEHESFSSAHVSTLRTGIIAGALCPENLMRRLKNELHMSDVSIGYGMTETAPLSTMTSINDSIDIATQTVGRVLPHTEVKIVDPNTHKTIERGEIGEFCARGYNVMQGYWNNPQATHEAIDDNGWMHSGDLATMDHKDYVSILGRLNNMIIRGGENIYPQEIENFLHSHPDISDVHVIGISDEEYGEIVCAFIKAKTKTLTHENLKQFCHEKISHFKIPKHWFFRDSFPMTVTGKVQKFKLIEIATDLLNNRSVNNKIIAN